MSVATSEPQYVVVVNAEEQRSIWPADERPPSGWRTAGGPADRATCLETIAHIWRDQRPASLRAFSRTPDGSGHASLVGRIEAEATNTPDAPAVELGQRRLSYAALNERANRLARHLEAHGARHGALVGVLLERSLELPIALLAILKTGAAYLPLDPGLPDPRLRFILEDADASIVVSDATLAGRCSPEPTWVRVDADAAAIARQPAADRPVAIHSQSAVYVVYTSGSTGRPKGVTIPYEGLLDLVDWRARDTPLQAGDRVLQSFSIAFDPSVWEFLGPLSAGATVVMAERDPHRDVSLLAQLLREHAVAVVQLVPPVLRALMEEVDLGTLPALRHVHCGGETLPADVRDRFLRTTDAVLHNWWGATEATVGSTDWRCSANDPSTFAPIGRAIGRARIQIVDAALRPLGDDETGELCVAGPGLAWGYINRPDLTAERFVPDPSSTTGERIYRTGDQARRRGEAIEFLGRLDEQIQIRGLRVEPAEVERTILRHPAIEMAAVVAGTTADDGVQLIAYVSTRDEADLAVDEVRAFLLEHLPAAMVPTTFVPMQDWPLNHNGKIDRPALPEPPSCGAAGVATAPAETPTQRMLATLWSQVLGIAAVGIDDDFFMLGGHSLLAVRLAKAVQDACGTELPVAAVFERPTIRELSVVLDGALEQQASGT